MASNYDDIVNGASEDETSFENISYDDVISKEAAPEKTKFDRSVFAAERQDPDRTGEAINVARKRDIDVGMAGRNLEKFKQADEAEPLNYEDIVAKSPKLSQWMQRPEYATVGKDDVGTLARVEPAMNRFKRRQTNDSFTDDVAKYGKELGDAGTSGFNTLKSSMWMLGATHGKFDLNEAADAIAENEKKVSDIQSRMPLYAKEAQEVMAKEGEDVDRAASKFFGSYKKISEGKILEGLIDMNVGRFETVIEALDFIGEAAANPKATFRTIAESSAFSLPVLGASAVGTGVGALTTGPVGLGVGVAGTFAAGTATEAGAWMLGEIKGRGYDTTDPDQIKAAIRNTEMMTEIRGEAYRKGLTVAAVDTLTLAFGGRFLKGITKGAGKATKKAAEVGLETVGEGTGELLSQVAAKKDISAASPSEALFESIASLGQSAVQSSVSKTLSKGAEVVSGGKAETNAEVVAAEAGAIEVRDSLPESTVEAAKTLHADVSKAQQSLVELDALNDISEIATESKAQSRSSEAFSDLVNQGESDQTARRVFFQKKDWDAYWNAKGESPVAKAEELLGVDGPEVYDNAGRTGQPLEAKVSDYANSVASKEEFKEIENIVRTTPDGMTKGEAVELIQQVPKVMQTLHEEAIAQKKEVDAATKEAKEIKKPIEEQLKANNMSPKSAALYESFIRTTAIRSKTAAKALAKKYGVRVQRGKDEAPQGRVLNQVKKDIKSQNKEAIARAKKQGFDTGRIFFHGTDSNIKEIDISKTKNGTIGKGFYLSENKDFANIFAKSKKENILSLYIKDTAKLADSDRKLSNKDIKVIKNVLDEQMINWLENNEDLKVGKAFGDFFRALGRNTEERVADIGVSENLSLDVAKALDISGVEGKGRGEVVIFDPSTIRSIEAKFDPAKSKSANIFAQEEKGRIIFDPTLKDNVIELMENADESTFMHEMGHYFLEIYKDLDSLKETPQDLKDDFQSVLKWLGVEKAEDIKTEHHEQWARGFEAYLREGKAPNQSLRRAFHQFKMWLVNIYKQADELNVTLSDDIRGVMDRMIATEDEIRAIKGQEKDMFPNPIASGMTKARAVEYDKAKYKAEMFASEKLASKMIKQLDRKQTKAWKTELKSVKSEVMKEVNDSPLYKALANMQRGTLPDGSPMQGEQMKINKQSLVDAYGKDFLKTLPKPFIYTVEGGMHQDVIASLYGYSSGDDMISAILAAPSQTEFINKKSAKIMSERHGDLLNEEQLREEAEQALSNEDKGKALYMEYQHLASNHKGLAKEITRRVVSRPVPKKEVKAAAERTIQKVKVEDVRPHTYKLAEQRYRKEAGVALTKGDIEGAFAAKQKELYNHELYRAAIEAREKINKGVKDTAKFFQSDKKLSKTRDMDLINTGRAILARYGLGKSDKQPLQYLETLKEYNPDGYEIISGLVKDVLSEPDNFKVISYEKFSDLMDTLDALWSLSKESKEVEIEGKKVEVAQAAEELVEDMEIFKKPGKQEQYNRTASKGEKIKKGLLELKGYLRTMESWIDLMDLGKFKGSFRKYLFSEVSQAADRFETTNNDYKKEYSRLSKEIIKDIDFGKVIVSPELNFEFKNKAEVLGAMLHIGNDSNKKKLLIGRGWGTLNEDGTLNDSKWNEFTDRMFKEGVITKKDMDYIQALWDMMESLKPLSQKAYKKIYGYFFNEIESAPIKTPHGVYKGGYAPAAVDNFEVTDLADKKEMEKFIQGNQAYMHPAAGGGGFGKQRIQNYNRPLSLDIGLVPKHIEEVLRFSIIKPAVIDTYKVVINKNFKENMNDIDNGVIKSLITPALNRADKNTALTSDPSTPGMVKGFMRSLRSTSSMQLMFANIVNIAEQATGVLVAGTRINPKSLMRATYKVLSHPSETSKFVRESSKGMLVRSNTQLTDMEKHSTKLFEEKSTFKTMKEWSLQNSYIGQIMFQNVLDNIVFTASYEESIAEGLTHEQASEKGLSDVRLTMTSNRAFDVSALLSNETLSFFQMFMNFFNQMANLNVTNFHKLYYEDVGMKRKYAKGFYLYLMGYASIAVISAGIRKAAAGGLDEDEDNEYLDDLFDVFIGSQIDLGLAMIPVAGQGANAALNQANDKHYDDRVGASPAMSAITSVGAPIVRAATGKFKADRRNATDALTALGIITGLPLRPIAKPIGYGLDVKNRKARPKGVLDVTRGLITGKPGVK